MLPTKILKLRLSRIQKGKEHLSTQDKLMLVSMESPDLSAHFLLRLFKVSLPKQWKFKHENDEDILYSTELIQLIEDELLTAYEVHARKYAWYEQCLMYRLNFIVTQPTQQQINGYLRQLDHCLDQQPKIELLSYFQQHYPSAQHAVALANAYAGATEYTQAIELYEWAAQQSTQRNEIAFYAYIECLLNRNESEYKLHVSDAEYAMNLLIHYQKPIDQKNYNQILQRAASQLLPESILKTRAIETNILADVGRGLNSLGKSLNGLLGGKQSHIPFSQAMIASAPQLLSETSIVECLAQSEDLQKALQYLLQTEDSSQQRDTAYLLGQFWRAMQHDTDALQVLLQPVKKVELTNLLVQTESTQIADLQLGQIQIILEQGLMAYLGDARLNKQHPERAALYAQRDIVVHEMTVFAKWFYQALLNPYLQRQLQQFKQVDHLFKLWDEVALSSRLFALQFEMRNRARDLSVWMQTKLEQGNESDRIQVAWVALRELSNFGIGQEKVQLLESALEHYKVLRLSQIQTVHAENKQQFVATDEELEFRNERGDLKT